MNSSLMPWAIGIMTTLVIGSYGFTRSASKEVEDRTTIRIERLEDKIDRIEDKLDRVIERLR